jgi:putative ABC transport system substrate-binding protein
VIKSWRAHWSVALAVGLIVACNGPLTPAATKTYLIGYLSGSTEGQTAPYLDAFRMGMRDLGYLEGRDFKLELRVADGHTERLPSLATELVALPPDVLIGQLTLEALALQKATTSIPIVLAGTPDPVENGLVSSLARPTQNITGSGLPTTGLNVHALQVLKDALPAASRVAYMYDPTSPTQVRSSQDMADAAPALGLTIVKIETRAPEDFTAAFATARQAHLDALYVSGGALARSQESRILDFVASSHLPSMFSGSRDFVDSGGLLFYGADPLEGVRRAATYVDRILRGTKPADLPVELTSRYIFVINLKTAKALGLTIPASVLAQATELIQ